MALAASGSLVLLANPSQLKHRADTKRVGSRQQSPPSAASLNVRLKYLLGPITRVSRSRRTSRVVDNDAPNSPDIREGFVTIPGTGQR